MNFKKYNCGGGACTDNVGKSRFYWLPDIGDSFHAFLFCLFVFRTKENESVWTVKSVWPIGIKCCFPPGPMKPFNKVAVSQISRVYWRNTLRHFKKKKRAKGRKENTWIDQIWRENIKSSSGPESENKSSVVMTKPLGIYIWCSVEMKRLNRWPGSKKPSKSMELRFFLFFSPSDQSVLHQTSVHLPPSFCFYCFYFSNQKPASSPRRFLTIPRQAASARAHRWRRPVRTGLRTVAFWVFFFQHMRSVCVMKSILWRTTRRVTKLTHR